MVAVGHAVRAAGVEAEEREGPCGPSVPVEDGIPLSRLEAGAARTESQEDSHSTQHLPQN